MTTELTIADLPKSVLDAIGEEARKNGQSVEEFVSTVLTERSTPGVNRQLVAAVDRELKNGGGLPPDGPTAIEAVRAAREGRLL